MKPPADDTWARYVDRFHARNPGVTEAVLARSSAGGVSPYEWLAASVDGTGKTVLDLACGSAPLVTLVEHSRWIGIDRSDHELRVARDRHPGVALMRADASRLPLPDGSIDTVVCSLALMVLQPLAPVFDELARVTRRGATFGVLLPASRTLSFRDRLRYARLALALRAPPARFPNPDATLEVHGLADTHGFTVAGDEQLRFAYPITDGAAADSLVASFYLPGVRDEHLEAARRSVRRWVGSDLGIPLRRIVATSNGVVATRRPR